MTSSTSNSSDPEDILVLGFRSTKFVVYSLMSDSVVAETECGGSHRSWCAQICDGAKQIGMRLSFWEVSDFKDSDGSQS